jgi:hypothetical protein
MFDEGGGYAMVDTLFSLAEAYLFMQLVELKVSWGAPEAGWGAEGVRGWKGGGGADAPGTSRGGGEAVGGSTLGRNGGMRQQASSRVIGHRACVLAGRG